MKRNHFIRLSSILGFTSLIRPTMVFAENPTGKMPVLFMGHGNPMNAILDNEFTRTWHDMVKDIPRPKAILCISAHWETKGTKVNMLPKQKLIYDMYGFPKELYEVQYPCDGSPVIAKDLMNHVSYTEIMPDMDWGLDHGAWSILVKMYPDHDIPCFQLSLNYTRDMQWHYDLGKQLSYLRKQGVLIVGSGNIVHNLRYARFNVNEPYPWAVEFDEFIKTKLAEGDHQAILNYSKFGQAAELSVNSAEHYIPMLYMLGLQEKDEPIRQYNEKIEFGSGSMRCFRIG